jgi:hypothetical protein
VDADGSPPRRAHGRRWFVIGAVVLVALGGAGAFVVAWNGRGAEEASVDDALRRFREGDDRGGAGTLRPAAGVYTYAGSGSERLSVLGTSQRWGATLPATVTHDDGCWRLRVDFSTNHWQDWHYCPDGPVLREAGGTTSQRFDFVAFTADDVNVFTCEPPNDVVRVDAAPGESWPQRCDGRSTSRGTTAVSSGTTTFVGVDDVEIGGEPVAAYRYRAHRTLTGDQSGTDESETWFAVRDGMPLRQTRSVHVESPSPLGTVTYTEEGTFTLTSLAPQR